MLGKEDHPEYANRIFLARPAKKNFSDPRLTDVTDRVFDERVWTDRKNFIEDRVVCVCVCV
jgi:hypothetical protein